MEDAELSELRGEVHTHAAKTSDLSTLSAQIVNLEAAIADGAEREARWRERAEIAEQTLKDYKDSERREAKGHNRFMPVPGHS